MTLGSLLSLFANNLLPIFLATGTGYVLGRLVEIEPRALSRVVFYVFSPALIFSLLTRNQLGNGDIIRMFGFTAVQMAAVGGLAWLIGRGLRFSRRMMVAVLLTSVLPNAGNFGLSVSLFAFGETGLAHASLYFVASGIIANTAGVYVASLGRSDYRQALAGLLKVPAIYAVLLAVIFIRMNWELPLPVARTVDVFSNAAIPTMLVLLGLLLQRARWSGKALGLAVANTLRLLASPAVALGLAALLGMAGPSRQAGVLEASMPTAVMTTVLASEFDVEPAFVTGVVFTTTMLSPLTLTPLLAYLGG